MKIKTLAVAIMLAAAGSANAAIDAGNPVNASTLTGSELFLTVFDPSAQMSFNLDMGGYAYDMVDNNAWAPVNLAADADYAAFIGQTDLRFTVTATYREFVDINDVNHFGVLTTSGSAAAQLTGTMPGFANINQVAQGISDMALDINANAIATGQPNNGPSLYNINNSSVAMVGQIGYYNTPTWGDTVGGSGYTSSGSVGSALDFYHVGVNLDELLLGNDVTFAQLMGSWSLDTNGMLTYTAVNAVPVPAAAWLFGSGLLGLVGVARRKAA